ncbi:alpha/beta fold hydrolase [Actinoallomurus sp. NBC_01490]|uniref:thioesterase II family protein n=1 Tax=Actinoallomurus sp. NBC_01490 TaxID=2903557 RepID=UPI002E37559A|nr:alpha/beta fold hydrolase [Actinoallomurus sp. NBC_01490]
MDAVTRTRTLPEAGSWTVRWNHVPSPRLRLFCLPHAGGGAAVYRPWPRHLPPDVEVVAIRLPGRESRFREPALTRVGHVVGALVQEIAPLLDRPHVWFGHSMGALLAFEVCRELRRRGLGEPARLMVSGRPAPDIPSRRPPIHDAPLPDLLTRLRELGGTPPEFLEDPDVMSPLLPALRADFAVVETYRYRPGPPLDCPISVFGGAADLEATLDELRAWRAHTSVRCIVRTFEGGHFYLHDTPQEVLPEIGRDLPVPWPVNDVGAVPANDERSGRNP